MSTTLKWLLSILLIVILGGGGYYYYQNFYQKKAITKEPQGIGGGPGLGEEVWKPYSDEEVGFSLEYPEGFFPAAYEDFVRADHVDSLKGEIGPGAIDVEAEKSEIQKAQITGEWQTEKQGEYLSASKFIKVGDFVGKLNLTYTPEEAGLKMEFYFYKDFWRVSIWLLRSYTVRTDFKASEKATYHNNYLESLIKGTAMELELDNLKTFEKVVKTFKKI